MDSINQFTGNYRFLSNFYILPMESILFEDLYFFSVEHAYQAAKTLNKKDRYKISKIFSPAEAKRLGKKINLRPYWDEIKIDVMAQLLLEKFKDPSLKSKLIATGDQYLREGNTWGDTYWGFCLKTRTGFNILGQLLMNTRLYYKTLENVKREIKDA